MPTQTEQQKQNAYQAAGLTYTPAAIRPSDISVPETPLQVPIPQPKYDYSSIMAGLQPFISQINASTATDNTQSELQNRILSTINQLGTRTSAQNAAEQAQGVPELQKQLQDVTGRITALQAESAAIPLQVQQDFAGLGATVGGVEPIQTSRLRNNAIQSLSAAAQASAIQGNLTLAKSFADKAVAAQFDPMQQQLEALKTAYSMNKDQLDRIDAKRSQALNIALQERSRLLDQNKQDRSAIISMATAAARNYPGDQRVQYAAQQAMQTDDIGVALKLVGQYQQDPNSVASAVADIQYKKMQSALVAAQINETNAQTRRIMSDTAASIASGSSTPGSGTAGNSIDQINFLLDTVAKAKALSSASGESAISIRLGDWIKGDSNYRRLEATTNTLRSNVLTLMTDPTIKKFFGPQMSNADVMLMTSAGTTLNPQNQSPRDMNNELARLENLFSRMKSSIPSSIPSNGSTKVWEGVTYKVIDGQWVAQ